MPSADLDAAVSTAVTARMINNGQSCIAAKRFIIHQAIYDTFVDKFVAGVSKVRIGDPSDEKTELGPLATASIRDDLDNQVKASVAAGAKVLTGGKRIARDGFFYEPTVLADIPPTAPAADEELFGPVASVFKAKDLNDAIRIANGTTFGLGASAWTRDEAERNQFIAEIESGLLFINGMVVSDPRLPFGGVKHSGFGRELGEFGIREFPVQHQECSGDGRQRDEEIGYRVVRCPSPVGCPGLSRPRHGRASSRRPRKTPGKTRPSLLPTQSRPRER